MNKEYTEIFATIEGVHYIVSVPTVFVKEIKDNDSVIDENIAKKIEKYQDGAKIKIKKIAEKPYDKSICPVCGHSMDMHATEPMIVHTDPSMSEESALPAHMLVCQVPNCHVTEGKQSMCFSHVPDELTKNLDDEPFENEEQNGVYGI